MSSPSAASEFLKNPPAGLEELEVTFTSEAPTGGRRVLRKFEDPRQVWVVEDAAGRQAGGQGDGGGGRPAATSGVTLVWQPVGRAPGRTRGPGNASGQAPIVVKKGLETLEWYPGTAIATCASAVRADVVAAVVDFAFLEGELRALEEFLRVREGKAREDLPSAHRRLYEDRSKWPEMLASLEEVAGARLTFARLEPQLSSAARDLSVVGRHWFSRLRRGARIGARLVAANDRLEALEEFYDAANQRIAEYRWYREGHGLEKGIIGLLVFEGALMVGEVILHLLK